MKRAGILMFLLTLCTPLCADAPAVGFWVLDSAAHARLEKELAAPGPGTPAALSAAALAAGHLDFPGAFVVKSRTLEISVYARKGGAGGGLLDIRVSVKASPDGTPIRFVKQGCALSRDYLCLLSEDNAGCWLVLQRQNLLQ